MNFTTIQEFSWLKVKVRIRNKIRINLRTIKRLIRTNNQKKNNNRRNSK